MDDEIFKYESCGGIIEWKYVKAHSGNSGNDSADRLAKWAAEASYHFAQFLAASNCPHRNCGCAGPNATDAQKRNLLKLMRRMLESRKKTSLQELMENRQIILP